MWYPKMMALSMHTASPSTGSPPLLVSSPTPANPNREAGHVYRQVGFWGFGVLGFGGLGFRFGISDLGFRV